MEQQIDPFSKDKVMKIESQAAFKKSAENLKYGEDLMEAIEMAENFRKEVDQYEISLEQYNLHKNKKLLKPSKPVPHLMMNNRTIFEFMLIRLKKIRSSELEGALKFLNFK